MKDQMISKGLPQVSDSRICIHISKAKCEKKKKTKSKCDSMFAEQLLSWLLYLNSFKLGHEHYLYASL